MLLTSWFTDPHRATRDLDLLGFGDPSPDAVVAAFKEILAIDVEDGVDFDLDAVRVGQIREELEYGGLRLRTTASISGARIAEKFQSMVALGRATGIPTELPDALAPAFAADEQKQRQWDSFLENVVLRPGSLADVTTSIARFIMPHAIAAARIARRN
jgi:hypothetical protein